MWRWLIYRRSLVSCASEHWSISEIPLYSTCYLEKTLFRVGGTGRIAMCFTRWPWPYQRWVVTHNVQSVLTGNLVDFVVSVRDTSHHPSQSGTDICFKHEILITTRLPFPVRACVQCQIPSGAALKTSNRSSRVHLERILLKLINSVSKWDSHMI